MRNPVWQFALRVFAWMPACFAAWYLAAPVHSWLAGWLGYGVLQVYKSGIVTGMQLQGNLLSFATQIKVYPEPGRAALLVPDVNPLLYTYGLALLLALLLASRTAWWKILVGAVILLPFQAWGIAFDLIAQLSIKMSYEVAAQAGILDWRREFAALGYQLGTLIFPPLIPVLVWAGLARNQLDALLPTPMESHSN